MSVRGLNRSSSLPARDWSLIRVALAHSRPAYLLLLPFLIHFVVIVAYPFFYSIYLSFFEAGLGQEPVFVGVDNYDRLFADVEFREALGNTFYFAIFAVLGESVLPLAVALIMNEKLRGRVAFRTAFFLPVVTSWVVVSLIWALLFSQSGIVNLTMTTLGLAPQPFLSDGTQAMWVIIVLSWWKQLGYYMIIYLAGLQGVPQDLVDAASVDGATRWQTILHIVIPYLRPVIFFVVTISMINSMQLFTQPFIMTNGGPLNDTLSVVMLLYRKAFVDLEFGYGSAISSVLLVILIVLSLASKKVNDWAAA